MQSFKATLIKYLKIVPSHLLLVVVFYIIGWFAHSKYGNNSIVEELAEAGLQTQGVTVEFSQK